MTQETPRGATLLTSIGTREYRETTYTLEGREHASRFCSVALCRLLPEPPARVVVLVTEGAREKWWGPLEAELREATAAVVEAVPIPDGRSQEEIWEIFGEVVRHVGGADAGPVALDITLAFRSLPFVYFASLSFLHACRGVSPAGVYYGALEAQRDGRTPIFDLAPLLALTEWYYAVRTFRETGDVGPIVATLRADMRRLFSGGRGPEEVSRLTAALAKVREPLAAGLPLELALAARAALDRVGELDAPAWAGGLNPAAHVWEPLREVLQSFAAVSGKDDGAGPASGGSRPSPGGVGPALGRSDAATGERGNAGQGSAARRPTKLTIGPDRAELRRQLRLVRWYLDHGRVPTALLLMREWIVNRALVCLGRAGGWLERNERVAAERALGALVERNKGPLRSQLTDAQREVAELWNRVADRRNAFAHAGFRPQGAGSQEAEVRGLLEALERRADDDSFWDLGRPVRAGSLLITALGLSPGVLFTALRLCPAERAVIVTSDQAGGAIPEALARAGRPDLPHVVEVLRDPFAGFGDMKALLGRLRNEVAAAGFVICNVTGGTTAMQHLVERLGEQARRLGVPVRRVALVDRRPAEEQRRDPYVLGECVDLDAAVGAVGGGDDGADEEAGDDTETSW